MSEFIPNLDFLPFTGEIEDNEDPLMLGRVRVRAHGYHSSSKTNIPTEDLPWGFFAHNKSEITEVPQVGEWVFGYFLDGRECQKPLIVGVLPGIVNEEPSNSRWARNEKTDETDIYSKKSETTSQSDIEEPESDYNAQYPYNNVFETPSGHLIEIDDTPGAERIHIYHKSGSFQEYHADGSKVNRTESDEYNIQKSNGYTITLGDFHHSIGKTLKIENEAGAVVEFDNTGLVSIYNNSQNLMEIINKLMTEIINLQTVGSPSNHVVSPTNIQSLVQQQIELKQLLK